MKLLIAGDFCPNHRVKQIPSAEIVKSLSDLKSIIDVTDYSIVNFECPVVAESHRPIIKKGPNLSCESRFVSVLNEIGVDCVTLANNHFRDYGTEACLDTIKVLENYSIDYVGGGENLQSAQKVLYKKIKDCTVAFVNICEHEFSVATKDDAGSAPMDLIDNYYKIVEAKQKSDYVVVITHGGHEHYKYPSVRMKKVFRWFVNLGADVVINHHQHCFSGYEVYRGKPIFYGLGNLFFDWEGKENTSWNRGYMVCLDLGDGIDFQTIPYSQCDVTVGVSLLKGDDLDCFNNEIAEINTIIQNDDMLQKKQDDYYNLAIKDSAIIVGNLSDNKIVRWFKRKGLLQSRLSNTKAAYLYDYCFCESHSDIVKYMLNEIIRK